MQLATMPLDRVPVVSLDLETTGLRVRADRIVQIGAIQSQDELARFVALVLCQQIADIAAGQPLGIKIYLKQLSGAETSLVKSIAGTVSRLDTLLTETLFV